MTGAEVYIKAENLQKTGSFKVRGVFNKMIGLDHKKVIAASMGNHAQAVAFAAKKLGFYAKIVMPITVPIVKEEATKGYGADVVLHGENLQEALDFAIAQKDYTLIHPYDDDNIIAGQATLGLEIIEDLRDIDVVLVPVGGGGLIAGTALSMKAFNASAKVIGVQTRSATSAHRSFREHKIIPDRPRPTLADGIAVGKVGERPFLAISELVEDFIVVDDETIALAVLLFMERKKLVVEGAGASPLAALLLNKDRFKGKRVVLVASGGNIDLTLVDRIIRKGLVASGRISTFEVIVDDVPGSLQALAGIIASNRTNILDISHDRLREGMPVGKIPVAFT
ncbi:MAG: L-threonine ammonia-lyase, partial [Deltaproteobacteria bacterium]|nr:L-threonine ammonia-lyase [Deltaproteobacteria bacterium]